MQVKQLFALTALALAGSAALADEAPRAPLTRAEVVQSVRDARARRHADAPRRCGYPQAGATPSTLTRAEVQAEVRQARDDGALLAPGEVSQSRTRRG